MNVYATQYGYAPTNDPLYANYATRLEPVYRRRENNVIAMIALSIGVIVVVLGIIL